MKINVKAFAVAVGVWWGIGVFALTWWMILLHGATGDSTLIGQIYRGYNVSPMGSVIGLGWGFIDGLVGGAVLAALYNLVFNFFSRARRA